MATNVDKGLYAAPQGVNSLANDPNLADIEVVGEDTEPQVDEEGNMVIDLAPHELPTDDFGANLAEHMSEKDLTTLASDLMGDIDSDSNSRKEWLNTYVDGLELLGLNIEDRTEPWPGACSVFHPLLAEALVKFQAETMMETFPAAGPVKTSIIGKQTPEKEQAAVRVKDDMNYQLTEEMPEYRPEHERMLWGLGLAGNAFKKVYFDPSFNRQVAIYVPAEDVVVPYGASSLATCDRITHIMRKTENELRKLQASGFYRDVDLGDPIASLDEVEKKIAEKMGFDANTDDRYKFYECQANLDLPGYEDPNGIALPYIVTIDKGTSTVLAIRRNWKPDDPLKLKRTHFVHYGYIPGFGFYHFGLIHLIGAYAKSGTMILRQLVDAGTLSNLPGGFKAKGLRIKGDDTPIAPAEFRDVDVLSGTIRDNILPLPYKEPSQVLQALMNQIIDEGRRFASAADLQVSDMSSESPVGTTLAILERTLKVMSAVQARIHFSMKQEFKLLAGIIRDYCPKEYNYDPDIGDRRAKQSDYDMVEVIPVSDPNAATMSQKVVQYQAVMQMAQASPQIYDQVELNRQMLEVLGVKNIGKLVPNSEDKKPMDPISENMAILNGKPVKAFLYQDHQAHIQVHMSAMQDPKIMQLVGQNPQAQGIQAAAMAHINEHIAFEYRKQIEEQLGVPLPPPDEQLPEDVEVQISRLAAQAGAQLLQKNQSEAQQQAAQQQAQDPLVQMQQQELAIRSREVDLKERKLALDEKTAGERAQLDNKRIDSQERVAGAQIGVKAVTDAKQLEANQMIEGARLGVQAVQSHGDRQARQMSEGVRMGLQAHQANQAHSHKQDMLEQQKQQAAQQHELAMKQTEQPPTSPAGAE